jgi:CHAT domain-containing protein
MAESASAYSRLNGFKEAVVTSRVDLTLGSMAVAAGDLDEAAHRFDLSKVAFNERFPNTLPPATTELRQAGVLLAGGWSPKAFALCRTAMDLLEALRDGQSADPNLVRPCLAAYRVAADQRGADSQAILADMFKASQRVRAGIASQEIQKLVRRARENTSNPRVAGAIRDFDDAERGLHELETRERALIASAAPAAELASVQREKDAQRIRLSQADETRQAAPLKYGQLSSNSVTAQEVFAVLRHNEGFASITLDDEGGWTFLLNDGQISVARFTATSSEIASQVQAIRDSIEPKGGGALPAFDHVAARKVYRALFGELGRQLEGVKQLTVAPSGPLLAIPFEILLTADAEPYDAAAAPWMVRRFTLTHVPSAGNFVGLRRVAATSAAKQRWFGFGDFRQVTRAQAEHRFPGNSCSESARLFPTLSALRGASTELTQAQILMNASERDQLRGTAFTASAVMAKDLRDFQILHFATHAVLPSEIPCLDDAAIVTSAPAGAVDAGDALLTSARISKMQLDANTVILSACNTGGAGALDGGESLSGLAQAFFYAGARSVLVTHWSVPDAQSLSLMSGTLENLANKPTEGLAVALQRMQLEYLDDPQRDPRLKHPMFWGAFTLIGEGNTGVEKATTMVSAATRG